MAQPATKDVPWIYIAFRMWVIINLPPLNYAADLPLTTSFLSPDCIFCYSNRRKKVQSHGTWTIEGLSLFEFDGWKTVLQKAEEMDDEKLLRRIRRQDLFACGAQYHESCRAKYVQDSNWRCTNTQECESQWDLQKADHDSSPPSLV